MAKEQLATIMGNLPSASSTDLTADNSLLIKVGNQMKKLDADKVANASDLNTAKSSLSNVEKEVFGVDSYKDEDSVALSTSAEKSVVLFELSPAYTEVNTLAIKCWSEDGAIAYIRCKVYDKDGTEYSYRPSGNLKDYNTSEEKARRFNAPLSNGLSKVVVYASASEVSVAGTLKCVAEIDRQNGLVDDVSLIYDNKDSIKTIRDEIDGREFSNEVNLSEKTNVITASGVDFNSNAVINWYVWSEDGAECKINVSAFDKNGTKYTISSYSGKIKSYNDNKLKSKKYTFFANNGISTIKADASSITTSGSVKVYVEVVGIKQNFEKTVINLASPLFSEDSYGVKYVSADNFLKFARSRFFVWVDDDGRPDGIAKVKNVCSDLGIKASFAVITKNFSNSLDDGRTYLDLYKEVAKMGYDVVSHSHTHGRFWESGNVETPYDEQKVCEDVYNTYKAMTDAGFPTHVLIYPYSGGRYEKATRRAVSRYFDCAFMSIHEESVAGILDTSNPFKMQRFFLHKEIETNQAEFESYIADCYTHGKIPVIGSHSGDGSQFSEEYAKARLQWLIDKGYTCITINELYKVISPLINLLGLFDRDW